MISALQWSYGPCCLIRRGNLPGLFQVLVLAYTNVALTESGYTLSN